MLLIFGKEMNIIENELIRRF